jgi:hypothetical protein
MPAPKFDRYGRILNPNFTPVPYSGFGTRTAPSRPVRSSRWERYNDFVEDIGEWIEDNMESLAENISTIFYVLVWIGLGIGIIGTWIDDGFWEAFFLAIIGGAITFYGAGILMVGLMYLLKILFFVARYTFYNLWSLTIVASAILGFYVLSLFPDTGDTVRQQNTELVSQQPNYICTARTSLNIRMEPKVSSRVIGSLKSGEKVYVNQTDNNFGRIEHNGREGWVSMSYLEVIVHTP